MAKGKKPQGKKRNIPFDEFKNMSGSQRAEGIRQAGIKRGARKVSRGVGRSFHAEKVSGRASEGRGVLEKTGKYAQKFNDPHHIAKEGAKEIISFNKKLLKEKTVKGKAQLIPGGAEKMTELRQLLEQTLKAMKSKPSMAARVAAKRAAKGLK